MKGLRPDDCDPADSDPVPKDMIPTGKYSGQTVDNVWQVDQQYVWFLSQRSLNFVQCLRYKDFFDSCPNFYVGRVNDEVIRMFYKDA